MTTTHTFGIQLAPEAATLGTFRALARQADRSGLDLLGVQDHPYAAGLADTFSVMATVLAETERLRVFPDVASLPMRGPGVLAKQSATLDLLSGGRFELALGAGAFWPAIAAMGGPSRTNPEALRALAEATEIIRAMWRAGETVRVTGEHYTVKGVHAGPAPAHEIGIWYGSVGPRAHALTGRLADGWAAPIPHYLPYEKWRESQDIITGAAAEAGRDPAAITRMAQLVGDVTAGPGRVRLEGEEPIRTDAAGWARVLADLAAETGFDAFVYWPEHADETQVRRWAEEVVPATRELLGAS
ncbi:LLM class flavin-dependent oxidoreductase [Actinomadura namibiensis]|uniref:Alkanesulfonate monooxygenase SsuD/methylene tetrahydromethanopterin reductase-like flavin-dependent oxidoreductase (Luciferase family) n=1 Tax=Actinomadura namibiensis TaxID=182080 RepID=A0A7W3LT04_ACTNM|nr:LLM class flavin-dependent oxidoreductase [Actinomadura namibiensis]MBA8953766.1 alkanesulfonate monooxygenase SsuD/methylene tetrahydromethanopterin reductase-like flavin-dependent oxidoreductase (luciferase family) [Actinomadura namibiensis]